jgi:uncharacterized repeat protein (TIGR03803 family)
VAPDALASGGGCGTSIEVGRARRVRDVTVQGIAGRRKPSGGLILDAEGNLYGVTSSGGANGAGTLFKVDPIGAETVLSSRDGTGGEPNADLGQWTRPVISTAQQLAVYWQ